MNGIHPCPKCEGDGFVFQRCGCREAVCPHEDSFGRSDQTEERPGIYQKFWVRRTDGSSREGQKHAACEYFVLDWEHDPYAVPAALAYAAACEATHPDLAGDLRARALATWNQHRPQAAAHLDVIVERMAGLVPKGESRG